MLEIEVNAEIEYVTVQRAMLLLAVSRQTIMTWLADNRFPDAIKDDGPKGAWRIPRSNIEAVRGHMINEKQAEIDELLDLRGNWFPVR